MENDARKSALMEKIRTLSHRQLIGAILLIISTLLWIGIPLIPFLPLETADKAALAIGVFIVAEATGYPGLALLGKETVQAMKLGFRKLFAVFSRKRS